MSAYLRAEHGTPTGFELRQSCMSPFSSPCGCPNASDSRTAHARVGRHTAHRLRRCSPFCSRHSTFCLRPTVPLTLGRPLGKTRSRTPLTRYVFRTPFATRRFITINTIQIVYKCITANPDPAIPYRHRGGQRPLSRAAEAGGEDVDERGVGGAGARRCGVLGVQPGRSTVFGDGGDDPPGVSVWDIRSSRAPAVVPVWRYGALLYVI